MREYGLTTCSRPFSYARAPCRPLRQDFVTSGAESNGHKSIMKYGSNHLYLALPSQLVNDTPILTQITSEKWTCRSPGSGVMGHTEGHTSCCASCAFSWYMKAWACCVPPTKGMWAFARLHRHHGASDSTRFMNNGLTRFPYVVLFARY